MSNTVKSFPFGLMPSESERTDLDGVRIGTHCRLTCRAATIEETHAAAAGLESEFGNGTCSYYPSRGAALMLQTIKHLLGRWALGVGRWANGVMTRLGGGSDEYMLADYHRTLSASG
jgi:hypothetical protein